MSDVALAGGEASIRGRYDALVWSNALERDPAQEQLAAALDRVLLDIKTARLASKSSSLGWLFARKKAPISRTKGLYIYGAVGRGKTMLMDLFFEALPMQRKRRAHFHDFMADAHERIHAHRQAFKAGDTQESDPIGPVARDLAKQSKVFCFDEFTVTDITDAMILSRLFTALFGEGCVLVATSNVAPDDLYRDGLNRSLFLPFIDLLQQHVEVFNLDARTDYRLEKTNQLPVFLSPLNAETANSFNAAWSDVTAGKQISDDAIDRKGRSIPVPEQAGGAARFSFDDLCRAPLSAGDYIEICNRYHTIFIDCIPKLTSSDRNEAKRFINLIDTLYDSRTRVFSRSDTLPDGILNERKGTEGFEFDRTVSRLIEMQSVDYLEQTRAASDRAAN